MRKFYWVCFGVAVMGLWSGCAPKKEARVGECPAVERPTEGFEAVREAMAGVDMGELVRALPEYESQPSELQVARKGAIPQPTDFVSDGWRYFLIYDDRSDDYWIEVQGGFAGHVKWRGPLRQSKMRK